jgi:hypothetical protein
LLVVPYAVIVGEDDVVRINDDMLGTRLMTWEEWQNISTSTSQKRNSAPVDDNPLIAELRMKGVDLLGF